MLLVLGGTVVVRASCEGSWELAAGRSRTGLGLSSQRNRMGVKAKGGEEREEE